MLTLTSPLALAATAVCASSGVDWLLGSEVSTVTSTFGRFLGIGELNLYILTSMTDAVECFCSTLDHSNLLANDGLINSVTLPTVGLMANELGF